MNNIQEIKATLLAAGIKPSAQRIAVASFLDGNHSHPTVDDIYTALQPLYPTLSRTTVYNTLRLFAEHNHVAALNIDSEAAHYDPMTTPHAHFVCTECNSITDLPEISLPSPPEGYQISETRLSFRGICPRCKSKFQTNKIQ